MHSALKKNWKKKSSTGIRKNKPAQLQTCLWIQKIRFQISYQDLQDSRLFPLHPSDWIRSWQPKIHKSLSLAQKQQYHKAPSRPSWSDKDRWPKEITAQKIPMPPAMKNLQLRFCYCPIYALVYRPLFVHVFPRIGIINYILKLGNGFLLFRSERYRIPGSNNNTAFISQRLVKYFTITGSKQTEF